MLKVLFVFVTLFFSISLISQEKAFQIYQSNGKKSSFKKMASELSSSEVVFFGELHDNPIAHWLEYEIAKVLFKSGELIFGAEMLESNDQLILDAFMQDSISFNQLDSLGDMWANFKTDYLPILEFAKTNELKVIATNVPRKYASMVYKNGIESLDTISDQNKKEIVPLPMVFDSTVNCYQQMLNMIPDHGSMNFPMAQAIKDATMAHFISINLKDNSVFYHINGSYHSENQEGILWYLGRLHPDLKMITITTIKQENISKLENENIGKANYIIVIDADMTSSY